MAEEEAVEVSPPVAVDNLKRKHEDLESDAPEADAVAGEANDLNTEVDGALKDEEAAVEGVPDSSETKRPRLDEKSDGLANENGHEVEKSDEIAADIAEDTTAADDQLGNHEDHKEEDVNEEQPITLGSEQKTDGEQFVDPNSHPDDNQQQASESSHLDLAEKPSEDNLHQQADIPEHGNFTPEQHVSDTGNETITTRMEVPNTKVGVLIGKAGDTIRMLQHNSGAKIQILRDSDADPRVPTRPVELIGTLDSIRKAERLIKDVIAEAEAGGSPSLVAWGFNNSSAPGVAEQVQIQVPNDKVGMIIGKGGETIKNLQTRSGARIQLIPQHLPDGDQSKERTVRVSGDKRQIEKARELIKEVMSQNVRSSGNYHQHSYRPRGQSGGQQWGGRGSQSGHSQQTPYDYQQRGSYPSQNQQYQSSYGGYAPRNNYGSGWDHRPPPMHQQGASQHTQGGSYDYYGGQGGHGHSGNIPASTPHPTHMGPQSNYNYGQPRGQEYGQQANPYSQSAPPPHHQSYGQGQGYPESQPSHLQPQHQQPQQPYGGHPASQQVSYPDAAANQGYGYGPPQQQYNKPAQPYGMASQGTPAQSYAPQVAAGSQHGDMQHYQTAPGASVQPYGQNVPQHQYPYASGGLTQAPYAAVPTPAPAPAPATNDGYSQATAMPGYPQQQGYGQGYAHPAQHASVYAQSAAPAGAYAQYPSQAYGDPSAAYGYQQTQADAAYAASQTYTAGAAAPTMQQGYAQAVPAATPTPAQAPTTAPAPGASQPSYDQSAGGYGAIAAPGSAAVGYGKTASPQTQAQPQQQAQQAAAGYTQTQYDASQMYGATR